MDFQRPVGENDPMEEDEFDSTADAAAEHQESGIDTVEQDPELQRLLDDLATDATLDQWWEDHLKTAPGWERLQSIVDELVRQRCRRADLLQALRAVWSAYEDVPPSRRQLIEQATQFKKLGDLFPLSIGNDFGFDDWAQMQELMRRCARHLGTRAASNNLNTASLRREAVVSLAALVRRDTGRPQYPRLLELLCAYVDDSLTAPTLRKMCSRAELPKRRALRPTLPRRRKVLKGREASSSGRKAAKAWTQAQIELGQWVDPDDDD